MIDQPTLFPVGKETLSWIRNNGRMAGVPLRVSLQLRWQSFWFERNLSLQRRLGQGTWQGDNPLFIMGLWRSGTTFMHELLAACPGLVWPTTWQCMNPSSFRIQSAPSMAQSVARPMDDFTISTFSPQEDEFALLSLGVPSVYRGFLDPGRLSEVSQWLDPDFWSNRSTGWIEIWREFLGGVTAGKEGRLLLKSPNHLFRIRALVEAFPNASYVWLVRDPAETLFSNRKMWVAMFRHYALKDWQEAELDEFLGKAVKYAADSLAYATTLLERDRLVVVDFDRFKRAPVETIEALSHRLDLGEWDALKSPVMNAVASRSKYSGDSYPDCLVSRGQAGAVKNLGVIQTGALVSHGL